jgi:PKD repeat protein
VHLFRLAVWTLSATILLAASAQGATRTVCASGCMYTNLQPAIDAAQPGDTILLRAGETFIGNYVLPAKSGTAEIVIRSDGPATSLPGAGVRLVPSGLPGGNTSLSALARLRGQGSTYRSTPVIRTANGAHNYRLQFLEIDGKNQEGYETLIALGNNTSQTSTSLAPYAITLDRLYIHGDAARGQKRCLSLDSASTNILNSYFLHCKHFTSDAQAIGGFNGPGPFKIDNNYLEASTENVMFGGSDPKIPNLVPSDITITRNLLTKPLAWRNAILSAPGSPRVASSSAGGSLAGGTHYFKVVALLHSGGDLAYSAPSSEVAIGVSGSAAVTVSWSAVSGATGYRIYRGTSAGGEKVYRDTNSTSTTFTYTGSSETSGTPRTSGTKWNVKNTIELKNAQRVRIEGNIIENNWQASQTGYAIVLTPRNQGNTAPWTVVQDVTIRSNIVRHVNGAINILGSDYSSSTGSQLTRRISIVNNVFDDISSSTWGSGAHFLSITSGPAYITVDHNTVFHTSNIVLIDNGQSPGFVFTNNMMKHNTYGIFGSGAGAAGNATLSAYFPGAIVRRNVLHGGPASLYPPENYFPTGTYETHFVNYAAQNYALRSGSPYLGGATDGKNIGVDIAALTTAQGSGGGGGGTTNASPTANPGGPYSGRPGVAIAFNGSGSRDADGSISSYRWEWGDGTSAGSGATPSHTYASSGTFTVRLTVTDNAGATGTATTTASVQAQSTTSAADIVLTAADVTVIRGSWARISSTTGAGGQLMSSTNNGTQADAPIAAPANYFEAPFMAAANTNYQVWLRLRAPTNYYKDDSVWVQFTGAVSSGGAPLWRTGTTSGLLINLENCAGCGISGWGWQNRAYWLSSGVVRFEAAGPQTVRIQPREDGVQVDQIVLSPVKYLSAAPGSATNDGTVLPRTGATLTAKDVVLRADDSVKRQGNWLLETDSTGADGRRLGSLDLGWWSTTAASAAPANYAEVTFTAVKGVRYRTWLRLSAVGNSGANDSVWLQYDGSVDGSGNAVNRIGTTAGVPVNLERCSGCGMSGWGWVDGAWFTGQAGTVTFSTTGTQRLRIQTREDGVRIDQVVISPVRYISSPPGPVTNDRTIVRPDGTISTY